MEFDGTFEIEDATIDEVWLALSDPVLIRNALPGCQFLLEVEDDRPDFDALRERSATDPADASNDPEAIRERAFAVGKTYAALVEVGVGSVNPSFETVVTIDEREKYRMSASGEGSATNSSFEMSSGMELVETDEGNVAVDWSAEADVFGRIAQLGGRVINPVANRVVEGFFEDVREGVEELEAPDDGSAGDGSRADESTVDEGSSDEQATEEQTTGESGVDEGSSGESTGGDPDGTADEGREDDAADATPGRDGSTVGESGSGPGGTTPEGGDDDSGTGENVDPDDADGGLVARIKRLFGKGG